MKTQKGSQRSSNKSIRKKITNRMVLFAVIALLVVGVLSCVMQYRSSMNSLQVSMIEMAELASERVRLEIVYYKMLAEETGCIARLGNPEVSFEDKKSIMDIKLERYDLVESNIIDENGINIFNNVDCSDRAYFKKAMNGNVCISEPAVSKVTGKLTMFISAPLWEGGIPDTRVVGVIMMIPREGLPEQDYAVNQYKRNRRGVHDRRERYNDS